MLLLISHLIFCIETLNASSGPFQIPTNLKQVRFKLNFIVLRVATLFLFVLQHLTPVQVHSSNIHKDNKTFKLNLKFPV